MPEIAGLLSGDDMVKKANVSDGRPQAEILLGSDYKSSPFVVLSKQVSMNDEVVRSTRSIMPEAFEAELGSRTGAEAKTSP